MKYKFILALLVSVVASTAYAEGCETLCSQDFWEDATIADVEEQLGAQGSINDTDNDDDGYTALHIAASYGTLEHLELLLAAGADPNTQNKRGATPLSSSTVSGAYRISSANKLALLLSAGANVSFSTNDGVTALHAAAQLHDNEAVKVLLNAGADANALMGPGYIPLWIAVTPAVIPQFGDRGELIKLLLDAGADVNAAAEGRVTPLHLIAMGGDLHPYSAEERSDHILLLLNMGADATLLNEDGETAFDLIDDQSDFLGTAGYEALEQAVRE